MVAAETEEPNSSSDASVAMAGFSKWKARICFSPFCAAFPPLSQLCHSRVKNSLGQRKRLLISLEVMASCWGFLAIYTLAFLYSVQWLFKCILYKQISKSFKLQLPLHKFRILQSNEMAEVKWFLLSRNVILPFSDAAALYIQRNNCFLGKGLKGWGGIYFPLSRFAEATLLWLIVRV